MKRWRTLHYRNTSPIGRGHEPLSRAAGSSPGVPIGFERSTNTILPQKNIICRENFVEITRFFLFSFPI
nr:MAG TPA: hypothetical protein [Siphoviridae sp. ct7ub6]